MMRTREEQIAERRAKIPKLYRGTYDKAVGAGKQPCTFFAWGVVATKSKRFISVPTWRAPCIRIDRSPESRR